MTADLPVIAVIPQRHKADCAIVCLAMLLGVTYEEALIAMGGNATRVLTGGAYTPQIKAAAKKLGHVLCVRRTVDLDADTGVLCVKAADWPTHHLVMLTEGRIVDDCELWYADAYLAHYRATPTLIFITERN